MAQWLERLTVSPVMHASRVRTPLFPCGVFIETALFLPSQCDHVNAITLMAASSSEGRDQCIDVNFAQGPALRAPRTRYS